MRSVPDNPLSEKLKLTSRSGPQASPRTRQVLRVCNLEKDLGGDPRALLEQLSAIIQRDPSAEGVYALSELAYLAAKKAESKDPQLAVDFYGTSVLRAYEYLFDARFARFRNSYDPQFRGACDLYNSALEGALRIVCSRRPLQPGTTCTIRTAAGDCDILCTLRGGRWGEHDFKRIEFVSDFEIKGLRNHYRTHGLGVPLIAVRRSYSGEPAIAKYYPVDMSFPVTAFLRPLPSTHPQAGRPARRLRGVLELYDPLSTSHTPIAGMQVPLQSDLTTPLAYFLSKPELQKLALIGLLRPDALLAMRPDRPDPIMGLYMAQPYEPGKIPVLLVHGLWSDPMTWIEMFNDLRSQREIRDHYQFWFYLYPTGQPFWISAAQLRRDLAETRQVLDPRRQEPALDQMVLIGHSMGGLVSKLQTTSSQERFWRLVSREPFDKVRAEPEVRHKLQASFFFQPNPSIRRVITIGTPHRGSNFSNQTTQWLMARLINLPQMLVGIQEKLLRENQELFGPESLLRIQTSVDSLAPDCPIFPVMLASRPAPWVTYHNIFGQMHASGWLNRVVKDSDGVVSLASARVADAETELLVPADHSSLHTHPLAILEVRQILLDHLAELRGRPLGNPVAEPPAVRTADGTPLPVLHRTPPR